MRLILLTILFGFTPACAEDEVAEETEIIRISNAFLTGLDASLTTDAATMSSTSVASNLASYEHLYLNAPAVTDAERDCFNAKLNKVAVRGVAKGVTTYSNINHGIDIDYKSCRKLGVADGITVQSSQLRLFQKFECEYISPDEVEEDPTYTTDTADLSAFSGKGSLMLSYGRAASCTTRTWQLTADITSSISGVTEGDDDSGADDQAFSYTERTILLTGDENLQPCKETLSETIWTMDTECQFVKRTVRSNYMIDGDRVDAEEDYIKLIPSTAVTFTTADSTSVWFTSGTFTTTINNWTGSVVYSAADTAPTYTLANDVQTLTGSLTARSDPE